jgi:hypothetical protein
VSLPAEILTTVSSDPRATVRRTIRLQVSAQLAGGAVQADIRNLSENGLLVETTMDLAIGEILHFELPQAGIRQAQVVWSRGRLFGCEYKTALTKGVVSAALLRSANERSGRDASVRSVDVSPPEERDFRDAMDASSLPVLVISLVVFVLVVIIAMYAFFEGWFVPY